MALPTLDEINEPEGRLFYNPQSVAVGVYTPSGRRIEVLPWRDKKGDRNPRAIYVVRGEHYGQFGGDGGVRGPLSPFPAELVKSAPPLSDVDLRAYLSGKAVPAPVARTKPAPAAASAADTGSAGDADDGVDPDALAAGSAASGAGDSSDASKASAGTAPKGPLKPAPRRP